MRGEISHSPIPPNFTLTFLSQICSGLLPMLYRMDRKPDWKVFLNIVAGRSKEIHLEGELRSVALNCCLSNQITDL
jgi:hypothetical protein